MTITISLPHPVESSDGNVKVLLPATVEERFQGLRRALPWVGQLGRLGVEDAFGRHLVDVGASACSAPARTPTPARAAPLARNHVIFSPARLFYLALDSGETLLDIGQLRLDLSQRFLLGT